jgi:phosphate/sulfate permease
VIALWVFRSANPHRVDRGFRIAQIFSATSLALGHGLQDAQKSAGESFRCGRCTVSSLRRPRRACFISLLS